MSECSTNRFRAAHVVTNGDRVEGGEFIGSQADCNYLRGLCSTTRSTSTAPLEFLDVVAVFGFVSPLLDLFVSHLVFAHANIVNEIRDPGSI